jgi:hypothetical protein
MHLQNSDSEITEVAHATGLWKNRTNTKWYIQSTILCDDRRNVAEKAVCTIHVVYCAFVECFAFQFWQNLGWYNAGFNFVMLKNDKSLVCFEVPLKVFSAGYYAPNLVFSGLLMENGLQTPLL